jgi:hypothetical protein
MAGGWPGNSWSTGAALSVGGDLILTEVALAPLLDEFADTTG